MESNVKTIQKPISTISFHVRELTLEQFYSLISSELFSAAYLFVMVGTNDLLDPHLKAEVFAKVYSEIAASKDDDIRHFVHNRESKVTIYGRSEKINLLVEEINNKTIEFDEEKGLLAYTNEEKPVLIGEDKVDFLSEICYLKLIEG